MTFRIRFIGSAALIAAAISAVGCSSDTTSTTTTTVTTPGPATQLTLTLPPSAVAASGVAFVQQPVVQLRDASGLPVDSAGVTVTVTIAGGGGTLAGATTATTNASGAATFTNLALYGLVGARTLTFASGSLYSVLSGTITLTAGAANRLIITTQPSATIASGVAFPVQPALAIVDSAGNPVNLVGAIITAAVGSGGGTLGGTVGVLSQPGGVASFTNLAITGAAGARTLLFTSSGLSSVTSTTVAVP